MDSKKEISMPSPSDKYIELSDRKLLTAAILQEVDQDKSTTFLMKVVFWTGFAWFNIFLITFFIALLLGKLDVAQVIGIVSSAPILALISKLIHSLIKSYKPSQKSLIEKTQFLISDKRETKPRVTKRSKPTDKKE